MIDIDGKPVGVGDKLAVYNSADLKPVIKCIEVS